MIKKYCDKCKKEIDDSDFRFEGVLVEIRTLLANPANSSTQPQIVKKEIHLCKTCYRDNINI